MNFRDILLVLLLAINGFLAYSVYDMKNERNTAEKSIRETGFSLADFDNQFIAFSNYNTLLMLKTTLPEKLFNGSILPLAEESMADGYIDRTEWKALTSKILAVLEANGLNFPSLFVQALKEKSLKRNMQDAFEGMGKSLSTLGSDVEQGMSDVLDKLNESMDDVFSHKKTEKNDGTTI